jgi:hypothetical protein
LETDEKFFNLYKVKFFNQGVIMKRFNLVLVLSLLFLASCATRRAGWETQTEKVTLSAQEIVNTQNEALKLWEGRVEQSKLEQALARFEQIHQARPDDLSTLIYLTRGYYLLADAHIQETEQKKKTYEKAANFGERAMATNPGFREKVAGGKSVEEGLSALTAKEVPAIYWTAASLGKWAKASGIAAALKYKTRIKAMIERVGQLEPEYFYGAVPRYWGGFFAVAPSFAGGDMKKSRENFDKSLKIAPGYLGTKVLMADVYWTKQGNKAEFKNALNEVLKSRADIIPELTPENTLEQKKAEKLLQQMNDLF